LPNRAKVVVAYLDGRRLKGYTNDFSPARNQFFLFPEGQEPNPGERGIAVKLENLKAVFFVKDFTGNPQHKPSTTQLLQGLGKGLEITFADNEMLIGTSVAYNAKALGFFIQPADATTNNERIFVVNQNVRQVRIL
jgi:hypothetical protein